MPFLKVSNVNKYNHITNKMDEIFNECIPVVKLVEPYASCEHL